MINSAARSLVSGKKWYRNISAGNPLYSEMELISTTYVTSDTASVTFNVTGLGSSYKHLQIRMAANISNDVNIRFNSDTGNNYSYHLLYANIAGGNVASGASSTTNKGYLGYSVANAQVQDVVIADILDAFSTSKYKTVRALSGVVPDTTTSRFVMLQSSLWQSTAAITSVQIFPSSGNISNSSRISIYGIKG